MDIEDNRENSTSKKSEKDQARLLAMEKAVNIKDPTAEPEMRIGKKRDISNVDSDESGKS
jgi:hypothetical protein